MSTNPAQEDILRILQFEHWLRFYFIHQHADGKTLSIKIPADRMTEIEEKIPDLKDLAILMDGQIIDQQSSQEMTFAFLGSRLDGPKYTSSVITKVLDSKEFQVEMQLFGLWAQGHESYLDSRDFTFADWQEHFAGWKTMDKVQEFRTKMLTSKAASKDSAETTTH